MSAPVLFVDREGDAWRVGDRTPDGDVVMVCDAPTGSDDVGGPGPTDFLWTHQRVEMWFGPLVPAVAA